jgi:hypothetical protein
MLWNRSYSVKPEIDLRGGCPIESDRIRRNEAEVTRQYTEEAPRSLGTLGEILKKKLEEKFSK